MCSTADSREKETSYHPPISKCKGDQSFYGFKCVFFAFCRWFSTTKKVNQQQCYLSGLAHFNDGEDGKVTVSFSAHTSCPSMSVHGPCWLER